jgi:DNA polymerase III alpha subunit
MLKLLKGVNKNMQTLERISQTPVKNLNQMFDEIINTKLNDRKVIEFLARANNMQGKFQLTSSITGKILRQLMTLLLDKLNRNEKVEIREVVELVSIVTTIIRPSSQSSGASKRLIGKALGTSSETAFSITNPLYEIYKKHTKDTFEELIYQEQLMTLINDLFELNNLGKADIYRRFFESNDDEKLNNLKEEYKTLLKGKYLNKHLREFWQFIVSVAGYSFNKSHAVSYTIISLITVYLSADKEYSLKYLSACINNSKADQKQTKLEIGRAHV